MVVRTERALHVRVAGAVLVVELALGLGACGPAGCCESAEVANYDHARDATIKHAVQSFEYERPVAEVWPEVVAVLGEHGYTLKATAPVEGRTLETEFKATEYPTRFLVRVIRRSATRYRITFDKQFRFERDGGVDLEIEQGNTSDREMWDVPWAVMQRAEPQRTAEIERDATAAAERAGAAGRGCDRGCAACARLVPEPPPK